MFMGMSDDHKKADYNSVKNVSVEQTIMKLKFFFIIFCNVSCRKS